MEGLYQKLRIAPKEFRLLRLHPAKTPATLEADLITIPLSSSPEYVALSYEWGPKNTEASGRDYMAIGAQNVEIRQNLSNALRTIRSVRTSPLWIWVDAICINQGNDDEREDQVKLMSEIYRSAAVVWVWVGMPSDDSDLAIVHLRMLSGALHYQHGSKAAETIQARDLVTRFREVDKASKITGTFIERPALLKWLRAVLTEHHSRSTPWRAVQALCNRTYWGRVWVLQEIIIGCYASRCLLWCGEANLDLRSLFEFAETIREIRKAPKINLNLPESEIPFVSENMLLGRDLAQDGEGQILHIKTGLNWYLESDERTESDFLAWLLLFRRGQCEDPRDKVYAVLGLAQKSARSRIPIEYKTCSMALLSERAARCAILESGKLDLLWMCPRERVPNSNVLPSWVPDLLAKQTATVVRAEADHYQVGGRLPLQVNHSLGPGLLGVTGQGLLEIDAIFSMESFHSKSANAQGNDPCIHKLMLETMIPPGSDAAKRTTEDHLWVPLMHDWHQVTNIDELLGLYQLKERACACTVGRHAGCDERERRRQNSIIKYTLETCNLFRGVGRFADESGAELPLYGLCPREGIIGDVVAVVQGCDRPLLLRQVPGTEDRCTLIGEVYQKVIMDSSVEKSSSEGGTARFSWRRFELEDIILQ